MCLTQACLPKDPWLLARGLSHLEWPVSGMPIVLRADNGKDFRSEPLRRGCSEYDIALDFRPIATPRFGGHIERLIGSTMGRIHLLPGTTFASPRERAGYDSEGKAAMTLAEFEHWMAVEISERYHRDFHRGLGATPLGVWEHSLKQGSKRLIPADPKRFRISFLPLKHRALQRNGLQLFNIRHWSDALPALVRREEPPGEEAQVDFGQGAPTLLPNGRYRRPHLFVMTLKYSGKSFRKVVWKADQENWARLHEEAFRTFGGSVTYVVLDNLKQGVLEPDLYEPLYNPLYVAMLAHYGAVADSRTCRRPGSQGHGGERYPAHPVHRAQGPQVRLYRGAERVAGALGGAVGGTAHPRTQETPSDRDVRRREAGAEGATGDSLPLLP